MRGALFWAGTAGVAAIGFVLVAFCLGVALFDDASDEVHPLSLVITACVCIGALGAVALGVRRRSVEIVGVGGSSTSSLSSASS